MDGSLSWDIRYGILNKTMVEDLDKQWDNAEELNNNNWMILTEVFQAKVLLKNRKGNVVSSIVASTGLRDRISVC